MVMASNIDVVLARIRSPPAVWSDVSTWYTAYGPSTDAPARIGAGRRVWC